MSGKNFYVYSACVYVVKEKSCDHYQAQYKHDTFMDNLVQFYNKDAIRKYLF